MWFKNDYIYILHLWHLAEAIIQSDSISKKMLNTDSLGLRVKSTLV